MRSSYKMESIIEFRVFESGRGSARAGQSFCPTACAPLWEICARATRLQPTGLRTSSAAMRGAGCTEHGRGADGEQPPSAADDTTLLLGPDGGEAAWQAAMERLQRAHEADADGERAVFNRLIRIVAGAILGLLWLTMDGDLCAMSMLLLLGLLIAGRGLCKGAHGKHFAAELRAVNAEWQRDGHPARLELAEPPPIAA